MIIINKFFGIGRLTKDPELRYTSGNVPVTRFTLAVNRTFTNQKGERETDFINVVVWKNQAENVNKFLKQGSQIAIEGRIQVSSYEQEGKKIYKTEVIAENVQFLDKKEGGQATEERVVEKEQTTETDPFAEFGRENFPEEDLPF